MKESFDFEGWGNFTLWLKCVFTFALVYIYNMKLPMLESLSYNLPYLFMA
jgi:hypothetical protein